MSPVLGRSALLLMECPAPIALFGAREPEAGKLIGCPGQLMAWCVAKSDEGEGVTSSTVKCTWAAPSVPPGKMAAEARI